MKVFLTLIVLLFSMAISNSYAIDFGIKDKRLGDVIKVKTDDQIAAWCNFNNQIVITNSGVLCLYNGKSTDPTEAEEQ